MLGFADIARLFEQIELRLLASLRRNLSAHRKEEKRLGFQWSAWQAEKLRNLDRFRRQNRQILHEYTDIIDDETRSLMLEQFDEGERLAEEQAGEAESVPSSAFFGVNKDKMDSLITDITTLEKTAESAALRMVDDVYRQTLHRVQLEMGTGSMTLEQAVDVAVKDFLDKGINCIQYADGRRVNIADYVRMALRTSATRATLQGQAKRLAELGYDTVATTAYGGCSETCEPWQGRAYIDDVFTPWDGERQLIGGVLHGRSHYCGKWFPLLSEATGSGLFHPNCRHGLTVYIDGRTELPKPIPAAEIKAQREREETQRRMEREIRKLKRFAAGTLDPDSAKAYRRKLREAQQELRLFIEQENAAEGRTVLRREYGREKSSASELTGKEKTDILNREEAIKILRAKIESGELPLTINIEKQQRHILPEGTSEMPDGRSYLTVSMSQAQKIIELKHLTGEIHIRNTSSGLQIKEIIETDDDIGFDVRSGFATNRATIHYSKTGTHLVPAKRRNRR